MVNNNKRFYSCHYCGNLEDACKVGYLHNRNKPCCKNCHKPTKKDDTSFKVMDFHKTERKIKRLG